MAFLKPLLGKSRRFEEMNDAAFQNVRNNMKTFFSLRLAEFQASEKLLRIARNGFYANYCAATAYFLEQIDGPLAEREPSIFTLEMEAYLGVISSIHTGNFVEAYLFSEESKALQVWFSITGECVCATYGTSDAYIENWMGCLDWLGEDSELVSARISGRVFDEIVSYLGEPQNRTQSYLNWFYIRPEISRSATELSSRADWNSIVDSDLA
jgi:hypothetical protein